MKLGTGEARDRIGRFYAYYSEPELTKLLASAGFNVIHKTTGEGSGLSGEIDPYILIQAKRTNG